MPLTLLFASILSIINQVLVLQCAHRVRNVHSIFVTSLTFLEDTHRVRAITGECDAALVSVSADCTSHLTKLGSRGEKSGPFRPEKDRMILCNNFFNLGRRGFVSKCERSNKLS